MSSQLQNKLLHYEVQPPGEVWNKIVASLDGNTSATLSEKLSQFEEAPPTSVWEKINSTLDQSSTEKAKVIPFYVRYRRPLKYSGAVAFFVVIAMVVSLLISKSTESEVPVNSVGNTSTDTNKVDDVTKNTVTKSLEENNPESNSTSKAFKPKTVSPETNQIVTDVPSDKYMILSDGDGNAIRLPKKLYTAFVCPTNNVDCKERLRKLKEKFASSAITSDFTGILEILKSLQENQ